MKIQVNRKKLLDALSFGGAVAGKCKTVPILDYCKVSIKGQKMIVTSTDTELTIAKKTEIVGADVDTADFCIVPSDLTSILATIRQDDITLEIEDNHCTLCHDRGVAKVAVLGASEFLTLGTTENKTSFKMSAQKLSTWFDAAKSFVSSDRLRVILSGMYLVVEDGEVWSCASDSFRLCMDGYKDETLYGLNIKVIIPPKAFSYASTILKGYDSVMVQVDDNNIAFVVQDAKISTRLITGAYPKVKSLLSKNTPIHVELNTQEFKDSISRMKLFADKVSKMVQLSFSAKEVKMTSSDLLTNKSCEDSCDVLKYDGDAIEVCTKADGLDSIISLIESESVTIGMSTPTSPIVIYESEDASKIFFTMPLRK